VIAIIITIMVLDLKVPHEGGWRALGPLIPVFLSYVLSFVFLGIYWSNHHHLFQAVQRVRWSNPLGEPASVVLVVINSLSSPGGWGRTSDHGRSRPTALC